MTSGAQSQPNTVQKFGNQKTTISDVGLGAHEGKYTPSSSVPDLATRLCFMTFVVKSHCNIIIKKKLISNAAIYYY